MHRPALVGRGERVDASFTQKRDLAFQLLSGTERSAKMSVADMLALLETT